MNFLKTGPEIKLSGIKLPGFLQDVYYDLKDRHLLPVAAILLIAIVAVPIAISANSESEEPAAGGAGASGAAASASSGELVAEAHPGLRDYRRRLDGKGAIDPFRAPATEEPSAAPSGAGSETESASPSGASESPVSTGSPAPTTYTPSESGSGGQTPGESRLTHYSYAIDVRVSGGTGEQKKTSVRKNLPGLTMLPSRETPAIVYMGSTKDGKKAVMTVSSDVKAIYGDAKCVLGSETCQMLVMEPGLPATFVYGGAEKTFTIELLKIELVATEKQNKAALGKPKNGKAGKRPRLAEISDGYQR
jgi:hypothetical protein